MCMFKAMLGSNNQQRQQSHDQTITRESFLSFYEVRDLKWKQVKYLNNIIKKSQNVRRIDAAACINKHHAVATFLREHR